MPELIVITFETEAGAEEARASLSRLPNDQKILIEEAMAITDQDVDTLGFDEMRLRAPWPISLPRALFGAVFIGACKATAWALVAAGTVGGGIIRGAQRIDGKSVQEIEERIGSAGSALFLITDGGVPVDVAAILSEQEAAIYHTSISPDNAELLVEHVQPD